MWRNMLGHSLYQLVILAVLLFAGAGTAVQKGGLFNIYSSMSKRAEGFNELNYISEPSCSAIYGRCSTKGGDTSDGIHICVESDDSNDFGRTYLCDGPDETNFKFTMIGETSFVTSEYYNAWNSNSTNYAQHECASDNDDSAEEEDLLCLCSPRTGIHSIDWSQFEEGECYVHYNMVFTAFVMMQIFNQVNSRMIKNEKNMLAGLGENWLFLAITFLEFGGQVLITQFGSYAFGAVGGLDWDQWLVCLACGLGSWPVHIILSFIPADKVIPRCLLRTLENKQDDDDDDDDDEKEEGI